MCTQLATVKPPELLAASVICGAKNQPARQKQNKKGETFLFLYFTYFLFWYMHPWESKLSVAH